MSVDDDDDGDEEREMEAYHFSFVMSLMLEVLVLWMYGKIHDGAVWCVLMRKEVWFGEIFWRRYISQRRARAKYQ